MSHRYQFGRFEVLPVTRQLLAAGEPLVLGDRAFSLLLCLIEHRDGIVSKDDLMKLVWPGLVVEENNLSVQISTLRNLLGAQTLVTLRGRGYRFAVEVLEITPPPLAPVLDDLSLPDKPSIAVLPFSNLSNDPDQAYFCDGITEDIITELSRFRSLFVIARNSAFTYKQRSVDVCTVARELGVRYVLEGSIRRLTNRIRVTVQLIDALTGNHIWVEKYDRVLEDVFAVQEEVTRAIVAALAPHVESAETRRVRDVQTGNLSAYQLAMRGWAAAWVALSEADTVAGKQALKFAREALAIDPRCGAALRTIAFAQWQHIYSNSTASVAQALSEGMSAATRAIAIDPEDHIAYLWRGMLPLLSGKPEEGLADMQRAHDLNPNDALALAYLGMVEALCGNKQKGIEYATAALRMSPRDPVRPSFLNALGWVYFSAGDYAKGADTTQRCIGEAPAFSPPRLCLVVNLVGLAEIARAKSEFQVWSRLAPELVEPRLSGRWLSSDPEYCQRATTFLRVAAGLQDPGAADALP
ncbi:MAG: winged helix-turn-helix domain-containing protein [Polaromonas sp.]